MAKDKKNKVFANGREIVCKNSDGKSVAAFPDVCFTPPQTPATPDGTPVPYPNTGYAKDTTKGSKTVKIGGKPAMLRNKSYFKQSTGDEAGNAPKKGAVSGVNRGKVYFNSWSMNVKIEGRNVVRHLDLTTHNHGSFPGNTPPIPHLATSASASESGIPPVVHARLELRSMTFSGGYDIDNDTLGDFPPPHFITGRMANNWPGKQHPAQHPYAIVQGTRLGVTAVFNVAHQPTAAESVLVEAETTIGQTTLRFRGEVMVRPSDDEVTTENLMSDVALPAGIRKVDSLTLDWYQASPYMARRAAGSSTGNTLYITLAAPTTSPLYRTLLEVSCTAAAGETSVAGLRDKSYGALQKRNISRARDNQPLTYWIPGDPEASTWATDTRLLLEAKDGAGQCGAWAEFLIDMWQAHGDNGGHSIEVTVAQNIQKLHETSLLEFLLGLVIQMPLVGFLVKNWRFEPPHPTNPRVFHYEMGVKCFDEDGVRGQNNDKPPSAFENHYIVSADGRLYDPSYGTGPFATPLEWENASIDGLNDGSYGGYRKSELSTTQLLEFHWHQPWR